MSKPFSISINEIAAYPLGTAPTLPKPAEKSKAHSSSPPPLPSKCERPRTNGRFLYIGAERFWLKGVTYGTFRANEDGEPFPSRAQVRDDFARMRDAGINTVRLYTPPPDWVADAALAEGLYLMADLCWGPRRCDFDNPERLKFLHGWIREHTRRLAQHPAMLLFSIGNEIPPLVVRWYGARRIEEFLRTQNDIVKEEAPHALTTYVNHPPTEYLTLPFLDVISYNIYLEREPELRAYLARLQSLAHEKPLLLAEIGLDAKRHGEAAQARFLDWQIRAAFEKGLCGVTVYGWTDEWSIFDSDIDGWSFGITDARRQPKQALATVRQIYRADLYRTRRTLWPMVSVIVCCYNAAETLDECLRSLSQLAYPAFEVIVVDDGSTDGTHHIAAQHKVQCIRVPNGGLSKARNLGIEAAQGDVVAFIDSDAYADPDWLYYMVAALEEHGASAVGGPNLSPLQDGFTAQCVDQSPGNPTCVLVDNERAEHIPGCNMAFRKSVFDVVGKFDAQHRAAGDDVDLCWRILVADRKIVYHPSAVVWHHRRQTIRAYLRQQKGYGYAEAHLQRRYPGRFNFFGYPVWEGGVYDSVHSHLRQQGLPFVFRPRIYRGYFCAAQFQSLYQPFLTWWFQIFSTTEWFALTFSTALSGVLTSWAGPEGLAMGLLALSGIMVFLSIGASLLAGWRAVIVKRWKGWDGARGLALVSLLHILQPLARTAGRIKGRWHLRKSPLDFPETDLLEGDLAKREVWLRRLLAHMKSCGWMVRPGNEWDEGDIEVLGPGPYRLKLTSVYEEDLERALHYVRYRVSVEMKLQAPLVVGGLMAVLVALTQALYLAPLAIPIVFILTRYVNARKLMTRAVSQMAMECGWPVGMPKAKVYY
ncbi:MAG TPA: glycosyltransferase [Verrucomicrobiae bacterium]|nr:glycosyltransferase [Verrucomicrobiae bacterium]